MTRKTNAPVTVVKVGGSLFELPDLTERLRNILAQRSDRRVCLVAGGGRSADIVRELQPVHRLSDEAAHRMAMDSMRIGEGLLQAIVPQAVTTDCVDEVYAVWEAGGVPVICATEFVEFEEMIRDLNIARRWTSTSDSVAAWVGGVLGASEVLLLKSVEPPVGGEADRIDADFERYAVGVKAWSWCNLRAAAPEIVPFTL